MNWRMEYSSNFTRAAKRLVKKHPDAAETLQATLLALQTDPFQASLKSHKLKGQWKGCWSCSAVYDLRIVFELVQVNGVEGIRLHTIGTHDEVY